MPYFSQYYSNKSGYYQLAKQQVAEKFSCLIKNAPGWYRAVENRFKRLHK